MKSKIGVKFGPLLPWTFRLLAACVIIFGLKVWQTSPWIAIIMGAIGLFAIVASEGTEINLVQKTYREYTSFGLFKTGKFHPYDSVEKIFINSSRESQKMYTAHTLHSSTFKSIYYNAYLKFANGEKIHLKKETDKEVLIQKLKPLSKAVEIEIVDNS
ncbi:MAG: hypothetical protein J0L66_04435 [Cytophagales bacterium]|nr:hypothetical protein [Cytophagales bacterium]